MSSMNISNAERIFAGPAYKPKQANSLGRDKGAIMHHPVMHYFGAIPAADDDGLFASASYTSSSSLITSTVGVALAAALEGYTTGYARNIIFTSAGDDSARTWTITGTDILGDTVKETVTGTNASIASSLKTFVTVTSIVPSQTSAGNLKIGWGNIIGLPFRSVTRAQVIPMVNGKPATQHSVQAEFSALGTGETRYLVAPVSGVVTAMKGVSDVAGDTASAVVTVKNGKAGTTIGTVTFASNYVAGVIQASGTLATSPLALNVDKYGIIEAVTDGGGGMAGKGLVDILIDEAVITAAVDTTPTATTGDTRGTINFGGGPDATKTFGVLMHVDRATAELLHGVSQYAG